MSLCIVLIFNALPLRRLISNVCVCVREREREKERGRQRGRGREYVNKRESELVRKTDIKRDRKSVCFCFEKEELLQWGYSAFIAGPY